MAQRIYDKINLPTNTTDISTFANYLTLIKRNSPVGSESINSILSEVKVNGRKRVDDPKNDTHTIQTLLDYGLIKEINNGSYVLTNLGEQVEDCYNNNTPDVSEDNKIALMLRIFMTWHFVDRFDRSIHPGYVIVRLLNDPDVQFITNHELSLFVCCDSNKNDFQYEEIKRIVLDFRNSGLGIHQLVSQTKARTYLTALASSWKILESSKVELSNSQKERAYTFLSDYLMSKNPPVDPNSKLEGGDKNKQMDFFTIEEYRLTSIAKKYSQVYLDFVELLDYSEVSVQQNVIQPSHPTSPVSLSPFINSLLSAIRTKPFILLAGISGTGKSRIVRKLAQATTTEDLQEYQGNDFDTYRWNIHKPENFEIVQVKPNWHNSMDVLGYLSNIPTPHYESTPLVDFIIKAWDHKDVPFFLCLDEMNLAPVEEYFAEFLSAIESRSINEEKKFMTDPLIKPFNSFAPEVSNKLNKASDTIVAKHLADHGLTLPPNLIVIGTVNMDETTFSFSRKVLDRAMSIEMNEVDYDSYISGNADDGIKAVAEIENLPQLLIDRHIEAKEFVSGMSDAVNVISYLKKINILLEGTPFKLGYRAANEALIYVKSAQDFACDDYRKALDEFTLMKILSRLEGDESKLAITDSEYDNQKLQEAGIDSEKAMEHDGLSILSCLWEIIESDLGAGTKSVEKIKSMISQLRRDHFVSYWN